MKRPYRISMFAILRDGAPFMALPTIEIAEAHFGNLSLNGFSKHKWTIETVIVTFPHETAAERRKRLDRHVQAVVGINRSLV